MDLQSESNQFIIIFFDLAGKVTAWNGPESTLLDVNEQYIWKENMAHLLRNNEVTQELSEDIMELAKQKEKVIIPFTHRLYNQEKLEETAEIVTLRNQNNEHIAFAMLIRAQPKAYRQANEVSTVDMVSQISDYAIFMIDLEGNVKNWNKGAEKIKGYKAEEIVGKNFQVFYTEEDRAYGIPTRLLTDARDYGKSRDTGWRVRKDDSLFWGSVTLTSLHSENGELIGYSKVTKDLTREHALEVTQKNLITKLVEKNEELEQFTYIASHDLRAPMNTILSMTSLLKSKYHSQLDEEGQLFLHILEESAGNMVSLVNSLLEHATIGGHHALTLVNINSLLEDIKLRLKSSIDTSGATIDYTLLPSIMGYQVELERLFQNLIDNALKYRKKSVNPHIQISAIERKEDWLFQIEDNGIGIAPQHFEDIFVIFKRLHNRAEYPGDGIGLANCQKIVTLHHGKLWVSSELGKGSIFNFTISKLLSAQKDIRAQNAPSPVQQD